MLERELRIPVARWFLARGLIPVCEVYSLRNCDMVGFELQVKPFRVTQMIAVELKLYNVSQVIRQCRNHLSLATETWCAMPPLSTRNQDKVKAAGIGLLQIEGGTCIPIWPAEHKNVDVGRWTRIAARRRTEYEGRLGCPQFLKQPKIVRSP